MPGYVSKSGLIYSAEEVAKIISDENWVRMDYRCGNVEPHEIAEVIEKHEREKRWES